MALILASQWRYFSSLIELKIYVLGAEGRWIGQFLYYEASSRGHYIHIYHYTISTSPLPPPGVRIAEQMNSELVLVECKSEEHWSWRQIAWDYIFTLLTSHEALGSNLTSLYSVFCKEGIITIFTQEVVMGIKWVVGVNSLEYYLVYNKHLIYTIIIWGWELTSGTNRVMNIVQNTEGDII